MTRTTLAALAVSLVAGCTKYTHVSATNAPGAVDISTPIANENGTDELYEPPASDLPKSNSIVAWLHPSFGGGLSRRGAGWEAGFGVSIERNTGADKMFAANPTAWGVSLGMGIVQGRDPPGEDSSVIDSPGPISLEAYRRTLLFIIAAGPVVYPDTRDAGAQVTVHFPLGHVRTRLVQDSGFELMIAWDLNFPLSFSWSQ